MIAQTSIHIPTLISEISSPIRVKLFKENIIQTIWVDSPKFSASYYKHYLGFTKLFRIVLGERESVLIYRQGQFVWIKLKAKSGRKVEGDWWSQKISLRTRNISREFSQLKDKVWVVSSLTQIKNNIGSFTLKDCNGIEIVYFASI